MEPSFTDEHKDTMDTENAGPMAAEMMKESNAAATTQRLPGFQDDGDDKKKNIQFDDDPIDATPVFLSENGGDVVEVQVDNDAIPMDEDDDDDGDDNDMALATGTNEGATGSTNNAVQDMSTMKIESHNGPVYAVSTHYDETANKIILLTGGGDDKAYLHHAATTVSSTVQAPTTATGAEAATSSSSTSNNNVQHHHHHLRLDHHHTDSVSCVAFNHEYVMNDRDNAKKATTTKKLAAVGAYDGAILLYDPDTGSKIHEFEGPSDVEWICFHPRGGTVLLAGSSEDGTVWMYHIPLRKCLQVFVGHESAVNAGSFSPDGRWAVTCSADGTVRVWAPKTGMSKHVFRLSTSSSLGGGGGGGDHDDGDDDDAAALTCMGMNGGSDGQLVIVGGEDGRVHVCHLGTKKVVATLHHFDMHNSNSNSSSAMNDDENDEDAMVELPTSVEAVGFAPQAVNPNWCASGGVDGVLKIWDLSNDGQCRQVCKLPVDPTNAATATAEDTTTTEKKAEEGGGITRLQWHPKIPFVFASYTHGVIALWDARNGRLVRAWTGHTDVINDMKVQFSNGNDDDNGQTRAFIVTASDDQTVRVFDVDLASFI